MKHVMFESFGIEFRVRVEDDGMWLEAMTVWDSRTKQAREVSVEQELSRDDFTAEQWEKLKEETIHDYRHRKSRWEL